MHPNRSTQGLAIVSDEGVHWLLCRNCSVTPGQLMGIFFALSALSLGVAAFFWFMGAKLVLPFTVIELTAVAVSFLVYARHATDRERISLRSGCLVVEQDLGGRTHRCEFASYGVRIESQQDGDRLVELRGGGQMVQVGRFLRSDLRPILVVELRRALRIS